VKSVLPHIFLEFYRNSRWQTASKSWIFGKKFPKTVNFLVKANLLAAEPKMAAKEETYIRNASELPDGFFLDFIKY
jgi:hypothetical protein